ncbi:MAG: response regulator [Bacteroidota bacterium]
MDSIKVLVVEDEALAAKDLSIILDELGYEVLEAVDNSLDAFSTITREHPDLVLIDINIRGEMDGVELGRKLNAHHPLPIIYLTAASDPDTISRAKETSPQAYLVKPFDAKRLQIAIDLAVHNFREKQSGQDKDNYKIKDSLYIKVDSRYQKLPMTDILFVEASGSYVVIHTEQAKHTLAINLHQVEMEIVGKRFMRVHRSYIVNLSKVDSFEKARLFIQDRTIPISKTYREDFQKRFHHI